MALYYSLAESYHWTPAQVDELDLDQLYWLPVLREAASAAAERSQDN